MRSLLLLVPCLLLGPGCGGTQTEPEVPPATPGEEAPPAPEAAPHTDMPAAEATPATWSNDLTKEQKTAIMKERVLPKMKAVLEAGDPEEFPNVTCKTCHGDPFVLPKEHLPKLTMKGGNLTAFEEEPEMAKFMAEKVVPSMAEALGLPPFDPQTNQGFGCGGCHTVEM